MQFVGMMLFFMLIIIIVMSFFIGKTMFVRVSMKYTNRKTKENRIKHLEKVEFDISSKFEDYIDNIEIIGIPSSKYNHIIAASYITIDGTHNNNTIILVHGHGSDKKSMYPLAKMFLNNGYNVLTYDQRNSGDNHGKYNTFGYLESDDLADCVDYIRSKISTGKKVGVLGQSMGGATVGFYSGTQHAKGKVDFVIMDSPFSNMDYIISINIDQMNVGILKSYLMFCGNLANKIKFGFFYKDMDVCKSVVNSTVPTLIIHSKADLVCPYFMGEDIYTAIPHGKKKLYTLERNKHIMGFYDDEIAYTYEVLLFMIEYIEY